MNALYFIIYILFQLTTAEREEGICGETKDDCSWFKLDHTLHIRGDGKMTDYGYKTTPWNSGCHWIQKVHIHSGIKNIGSRAFYGFTGVKEIKIPSSVTEIGERAFDSCNSYFN